MFKAILAATDCITTSDPVVITAARLSAALGVPWNVMHVLEYASVDDRRKVLHYRSGEKQAASDAYREDVADRLRQTYHKLFAWAPPSELIIVTGFPWEAIGAQGQRMAADLIVLGPHAEAGTLQGAQRAGGRIGSTVEGILSREHAPVMIIHQHPCHPKPAFKRLLVGIDFSASCEGALAFASRLACFFQGTVDLFHMLPVPPYPKYSRRDYDTDRAAALIRMTFLARQRMASDPRAYHIWGGALPHRELFRCAARCHADAVVLGSHTKETHGKWYTGSTVEKVSRQASFPVFVLSQANVGLAPRDGRTTASSNAAANHAIHVFEK